MYNRDSKIMRKLLGKTAADASTGDLASASHPSPASGAASASATGTAYRPSKSQNAVYPAGVPISCFDVAPDRRAAVLAGPHILKTVVLDAKGSAARFGLGDGVDVRAAIASRQSAGLRASLVADQLNIRDVKWHGHSTIFTACASGNIFAYDLTRLGGGASEPLECVQMHEDSRQVNSLDVNPHLKSWLLSGSQDGTARVFDTSTPLQSRAGLVTFRQRFAPLRCIDAVRQVAWSPRAGHEMACCTEAGVVLKWDVRHPARPLLRINAHEKACSAIAWHPDGIHLMSAGWDTKLHTWDLGSTADKRQKPKWTISTPAPVSAVAWRPGLWSATTQTRRVAQVAVAYDETTNRRYGSSTVHIWDLARPTMPYKEIERFDSSPTALMWQDQDLLWTVGQDGLFNQCDVAFAPKVLDRQSTSAMAFSPRGEALMFLDDRPQSHRPRPSVTHEPQISHRHIYDSSPGAPMLSVSRSDSEEEVMSTFLGPRRRIVGNRRPGGRSGAPLSTTPPSGPAFPDDPKQTLNLEQSVAVTGVFKSQQAMASGRIPAAKSVHVYQYLSNAYLETLERELPYVEEGESLVERVEGIMEQFARAAEKANQYRLAQTWRILAYSMALLLNRRAQYHLELRLRQFQKMQADDARGSARLKAPDASGSAHGNNAHGNNAHGNGGDAARRPSIQRGGADGRMPSRSLLAEEIESTSNVPTPLARPVDSGLLATDGGNDEGAYQYGRKLTPIVEPESLNLGPAAHGSFREEGISPRHRLDSDPVSGVSNDGSDPSQLSSTEGYDFYDTEMLAKAIDVPVPRRKSSEWGAKDQVRRGQDRQDSDESFGNMFSVSAGIKRSADRSSSSGGAFARPGILARQTSDTDRSSAASSVEYDSRVRGETMGEQESPAALRKSTRNGSHKAPFPDEVFMISQTTVDSDPSQPPSSDADVSLADTASPAAGNAAPGVEITHVSSSPPSKPTSATSTWPRHDPRPHIVESDYLPWDDDPPYPHPLQPERGRAPPPPPPLDPIALVTRALAFETQRSALNASAMVLLLRPLVPASAVDEAQASAIVRQQHARLMRMGLFVEAALLRNLCVRGWPAGLPDWGAGSGGGGPYATIFAPAQQGVKVGLVCPWCRKPREVDPAAGAEAVWTCERCRRVMAPCAVCGHREPERPAQVPDEIVAADAGSAGDGFAGLSEWWCCPGCAHGGHASCLQTWHAAVTGTPDNAAASSSSAAAKFSDGCCPLDGCGHACLPGKYRGETMVARADELGRAALEAARSRDDPLHPLPGPAAASASAQTAPPQPHTQPPAPTPPLHPPGACASSSSLHAPLSPSPLSPLSTRHPPPQPHHQQRQHQRASSGAAAAQASGRRSGSHARAVGVRGDAHDVVPQSKAVGVAREDLLSRGAGGTGNGSGSGSILGLSPSGRPASAPIDRERRKSVKFARPERD